jgi:uncharacterized protein YkwD
MFQPSLKRVFAPWSLMFAVALGACGGGGGGGGGAGSASGDGGGSGGGTVAPPVAPSPGGSTVAGVEPCGIPDLPAQALAAVNAVRATARSCRGTVYPAVAPLAWDNRLAQAAATHAADMAGHDHVEHVDSAGRDLGTRVTAAGYRWSSVAENLAAGQASLDAAIDGWLNSPSGHCENLMRASVTQMGLSCQRRSGTRYTRYWVLDMARPAK